MRISPGTWFRGLLELTKCLLFDVKYSYLSPLYMSDTTPLGIRRESSGAPHTSLIHSFVVVWVVWNNLCFRLWHFAMTVVSSFWRYLFVGIALMTWPNTSPIKTNVHTHLLWYTYRCQAIVDLILPVIGLHYHLPKNVIQIKLLDKNKASPTGLVGQ